jgi:hypothetical protein
MGFDAGEEGAGAPAAADDEARERELRSFIDRAIAARPLPLQAVEFRGALPTESRPSRVLCDDDQEYVVKGRNAGRSTFNDQVVGRLGMAMNAPVGQVALGTISLDLILENIEMRNLVDGVAHGSRLIPRTSNAERLLYFDVPENRSRFAALALLYGWPQVEEDHQFIYGIEPPHLVYSVDHGDFFPRGPGWSLASLRRVEPAQPDRFIRFGCDLTADELRAAAGGLQRLDDQAIATAVALPPDDWGVTVDERVGLALYLTRRREQLLETLARRPGQE